MFSLIDPYPEMPRYSTSIWNSPPLNTTSNPVTASQARVSYQFVPIRKIISNWYPLGTELAYDLFFYFPE